MVLLEVPHRRLKLGPTQLPQQLQVFVDGVIWLSLEELGQQILEHRLDLLSTVLTPPKTFWIGAGRRVKLKASCVAGPLRLPLSPCVSSTAAAAP